MTSSKSDILIKAALVGDYGVGKTSLFQRYIYDKLTFQPTIGVDFMPRHEQVGEHRVSVHLWDTAGQERFRSIVKTYFRGIYLFVVVFDVTSRRSFESLSSWLKTIRDETQYAFRILLVANKADRSHDAWEVTADEVGHFAKHNGIDSSDVYMVSAEATDDPTIMRMFRTTLASVVENIDEIEPFGGLVDRRAATSSVITQPSKPRPTMLPFNISYKQSKETDDCYSDGLLTPPDRETKANKRVRFEDPTVVLNSDEASYHCCGVI
jgi:small GTP-binding protein